MLRIPLLAVAALTVAGCASHHSRHTTAPATQHASTLPISRPALPPLSRPTFRLSEISGETLPGYPDFASVTTHTTFKDLHAAIDAAMAELSAASGHKSIQPAGAPVFIYRGADPRELDKSFSLEIGFPIAPGGKADGKVAIKPLAAMNALVIFFTGPLTAIDNAYNALVPELQKRKLRETGEVREYYLRWEGSESPNNQIQIGFGVE